MSEELEYMLGKFNLDPRADYSKAGMPIGLRMNRRGLGTLFAQLGYRCGAEIGTAQGRYAEVLCQENPEMELFCVDPWLTYEGYRDYKVQETMNDQKAQAMERLKDRNVTFIQKYSAEAAEHFAPASLDFVYIDANHDYEFVVADIALWLPKIRSGGIISGHDFSHPKGKGFGVIEAVEGWTKAYHIAPWFIFKGEYEKPGDRGHSWFWVKE